MARPAKSIAPGTTFNRLTVVSVGEPQPWGNGWFRSTSVCRCQCGVVKTLPNNSLKAGHHQSCGCLAATAIGERARTHGLSVGEWEPVYAAWQNMHRRCYEEHNDQYKNYGGRGIRVCERWHDVKNFAADVGKRPSSSHSIDRIDTNKDYELGNVRWATKKQQAINRRTTKLFKFDGRTKCIKDWAREWGVSRHIAKKRLELEGVAA